MHACCMLFSVQHIKAGLMFLKIGPKSQGSLSLSTVYQLPPLLLSDILQLKL